MLQRVPLSALLRGGVPSSPVNFSTGIAVAGGGPMDVVPQVLRISSSSSSTITPILRTHLLAPGAATPDEDAEPAPGPARADADAERTRGSAGADTEAVVAARNIDPPSPSSSSSSYFVRPMQVPLAAYIAAEGRIDIQREMEEAGRRVFRFRPGELPRLAGIYWRRLSEVTKTAWKDRAKFLNSRDVPGELNSLPEILSPAVILRSVNLEIAELQGIFRSAILRQPKRDVSEHIRMFATERVQMATQTFRSFQMSLLLQLLIFGPNLSYLKADEIITRTKKPPSYISILASGSRTCLLSKTCVCFVLFRGACIIPVRPRCFLPIHLGLWSMMIPRSGVGGYTQTYKN